MIKVKVLKVIYHENKLHPVDSLLEMSPTDAAVHGSNVEIVSEVEVPISFIPDPDIVRSSMKQLKKPMGFLSADDIHLDPIPPTIPDPDDEPEPEP